MIRAGLKGMGVILVVAFLAMPLPFAWCAVDLGHTCLVYHIRLFHPELPVANWGIFLHMVDGGVITAAMALLQLVPLIRRR